MTIDSLTKLLEAMILLAQATCWPLLVLFIVIYFGSAFRKFIEDTGEFRLKAGPSGLEASAKREQFEAAALLGAASASKQGDTVPAVAEDSAREIAEAVSQAANPRRARRLGGTTVLWVDDRPSNNLYELRSMEAMGIRFDISTSTDDALERLRTRKYHAVISDMGRPPDDRAGYTLLESMGELGITVPFIIYSGSDRPEYRAEARRRGAVGSTNSPQELFQLVVSSILDN